MVGGDGPAEDAAFDESGLPLPLPPRITNRSYGPSLIPDSDRQALNNLVSHAIPQDKLLSVIETIVSNVKATNIVKELEGNDAQGFADIMDEARHYIIPSLKNWLLELRSDLLFLVVRR